MQFDVGSLGAHPNVIHAAVAAKRQLIHSLATEGATNVVCDINDLEPLVAALSAFASVGYGWDGAGVSGGKGGDRGQGAGLQGAWAWGPARAAGNAAETGDGSVAAKVLRQMKLVAGLPGRMRKATRAQGLYTDADKHVRLWEALAACPPSGENTWCEQRLLGASARVLQVDPLQSVPPTWPYRMLLALLRLQHLLERPKPLQLLLERSALHVSVMDNSELSQTVKALGKLLEVNESVLHTSGANSDKETLATLGVLVRAVQHAVEQVQRRLTVVGDQAERTEEGQEGHAELGQQQRAAVLPPMAAPVAPWWAKRGRQQADVTSSSFDGREACQLLQGLVAISEVFGRYVSSFSCGVPHGAEDLVRDAQLVAMQAAAAAELAVSQIHNGGLEKLTAQELSGAALTLARSGYGTSDRYRALVVAAVAAAVVPAPGSFTSTATPAHWARLWHALALARHRPDDVLVRSTAAGLTKQLQQQQYGGATAEDCASLLRCLAELRCCEEGLVEGLLGRLVRLGATGDGGGVEVRDMTNAVWAVAVMGPDALRSHCGAVEQLLRAVVGRWEPGQVGVGAGSQDEQLRQLWQVQLELDGLVDGDHDGGTGASSDSSSSGSGSSSRPGHTLRCILPPDLLQAAEQAAREGLGGVPGAVRQLQRGLRAEVCSVLQGMVVQQGVGEEEQEGQGAQQEKQRAGRKKAAPVSRTTDSRTAAGAEEGASVTPVSRTSGHRTAAGTEEGGVGRVLAAAAGRPAPSCTTGIVVSVTPQHEVAKLRCTVDAVVELGHGRRVAVEVEGPGRWLANHPHTRTRTGPAEMRRRQLERVLGVGNVVVVPCWAWEELGGDRGRQEAWLAARLVEGRGAAGVEGGGGVRGRRTRQRRPRKQKGKGGQEGVEEQRGDEQQRRGEKYGGEQPAVRKR